MENSEDYKEGWAAAAAAAAVVGEQPLSRDERSTPGDTESDLAVAPTPPHSTYAGDSSRALSLDGPVVRYNGTSVSLR